MMRSYIIAAIIILGGGIAIKPLQENILREEQAAQLLPAPLAFGRGDDGIKPLEQQLSFVAFGGLRSLVAAFLAVNAHDFFSVGDWEKLEDRYNQITALAPHKIFYWDNGTWHLAYNAAADSAGDRNLKERERQYRFKKYIEKGINFLKRGIANNPDDWYLYRSLGHLYSNEHRLPDYARAAEAYTLSYELGGPPILERSILSSLAAVPGKEQEAYELARKLVMSGEHNVPAPQALLYALQIKLDISPGKRLDVRRIFYSPKSAEWVLRTYYLQQKNYPKEGIQDALALLKPYANSNTWDVMPHSDLEKLTNMRKIKQPTGL